MDALVDTGISESFIRDDIARRNKFKRHFIANTTRLPPFSYDLYKYSRHLSPNNKTLQLRIIKSY